MDMAVGRLQFSVRLADTRSIPVEEPTQSQVDPVEAAYRRERTHRDVTADRERWAINSAYHGENIL